MNWVRDPCLNSRNSRKIPLKALLVPGSVHGLGWVLTSDECAYTKKEGDNLPTKQGFYMAVYANRARLSFLGPHGPLLLCWPRPCLPIFMFTTSSDSHHPPSRFLPGV